MVAPVLTSIYSQKTLESKLPPLPNSLIRGAFGTVKLAQDKDKNNKLVAVKFVNKKKLKKKFLGKGKSIYSLLKREVAVMKKMVIYHLSSLMLLRIIQTY